MDRRALIIFVSLLLFSLRSFALGLGAISVESALNQPFRGQIALLAVDKIPLADINIRLASPDAFDKLELDRPFVLTKLNFRAEKNRAGKPVIVISSKDRIDEPYLKFLLDIRWPSGQFYRAYTVLLDPANLSADYSQPAAAQPASKRIATNTAPPPMAKKPKPVKRLSHYGPVHSAETIWHIAAKLRPQGTEIEQMVVALWQKNTRAFSKNNINGLRAGVTLQLPSQTEVKRIDSNFAHQQVMKQNLAWHTPEAPVKQKQEIITHNQLQTNQATAQSVTPSPNKPVNLSEATVAPLLMQSKPTTLPVPKKNLSPGDINILAPNAVRHELATVVSAEIKKTNTTKSEQLLSLATVESLAEANVTLKQQLYAISQHNQKLQAEFQQQAAEVLRLKQRLASKKLASVTGSNGVNQTALALQNPTTPAVGFKDDAAKATSSGNTLNQALWLVMLLLSSSGFALWWWERSKQQRTLATLEYPTVKDDKPTLDTDENSQVESEQPRKSTRKPHVASVVMVEQVCEELKQPSQTVLSSESAISSEAETDNDLAITPPEPSTTPNQDTTSDKAEANNEPAQEQPEEELDNTGVEDAAYDEPPEQQEQIHDIEFESGLGEQYHIGRRGERRQETEHSLDLPEQSSNEKLSSVATFDSLDETTSIDSKLELAKAYSNMGDFKGSREILAEVIECGSEEQKALARQHLAELEPKAD